MPFHRGRHGGAREGAGRPRKEGLRRVAHRRRPRFEGWTPVHVTLRLRKDIGHLRRYETGKALKAAFVGGCRRPGFRICHFSLQRNHLHLVCDAKGAAALSRGMQGFSVRFARRLNRHQGRNGGVFSDRYHVELLTVPSKVRSGLCYVLQNGRRHGEHRGARWVVDPYSSGRYFDGWLEGLPDSLAPPDPKVEAWPVAAPESALLKRLWRRRGLVGLRETPRAVERDGGRLVDR